MCTVHARTTSLPSSRTYGRHLSCMHGARAASSIVQAPANSRRAASSIAARSIASPNSRRALRTSTCTPCETICLFIGCVHTCMAKRLTVRAYVVNEFALYIYCTCQVIFIRREISSQRSAVLYVCTGRHESMSPTLRSTNDQQCMHDGSIRAARSSMGLL